MTQPDHKQEIIAVDVIKVPPDRFRTDFDNSKMQQLINSIKEIGLINPLVVDDQNNLVAGERRLRAIKSLGLLRVAVRRFCDLNEYEKRQVELEENLRREDLTWAEQLAAEKALHGLYKVTKKPISKGQRVRSWGAKDTAGELGVTAMQISKDLQAAEMLEAMPELAKERNKATAVRAYLRLREREILTELAKRRAIDPDIDDRWAILCGDAREQLDKLQDDSVDYIFADPPFGIDLDESQVTYNVPQRGIDAYDDKKADVLTMYAEVAPKLCRVLKHGCHMVFWFAIQYYAEVRKMLGDAGFSVDHIPAIWYKGRHTHSAQTMACLVNSYITGFYCSKGPRSDRIKMRKMHINVFHIGLETNPAIEHVAKMPVGLPLDFYNLVLNPGEVVLDPFAGSGAAMEAALIYGCRVIGIELNAANCELIRERMHRRADKEATTDRVDEILEQSNPNSKEAEDDSSSDVEAEPN